MIIQTDVACLQCGHVSWRVELERGEPWQLAEVIWPEAGRRLPLQPRCTRCGGQVYLDHDYHQVRMRHRDWQALLQRARAASRTSAAVPAQRRPRSSERPSDPEPVAA